MYPLPHRSRGLVDGGLALVKGGGYEKSDLTPCLPTLWRAWIPFFRSIRVIGLVPEIPPTGVNPLFWGLGGLEPGSAGLFMCAGLVEGLYAIRMPYLTPPESSWKLFYGPGNMTPLWVQPGQMLFCNRHCQCYTYVGGLKYGSICSSTAILPGICAFTKFEKIFLTLHRAKVGCFV